MNTQFRIWTIAVVIFLMVFALVLTVPASAYLQAADVNNKSDSDSQHPLADFVRDASTVAELTPDMVTLDGNVWEWQRGPVPIHALFFVNELVGWGVGDWGLIIYTSDGGLNWTVQPTGILNWLGGIQFVDTQNGWAIGSVGTILHTNDGGGTWQEQVSPLPVDLEGLFFLDAQNGWIGLPAGVLKTTDSGQSWTMIGSGIPHQVKDIQFFDVDNGVLASNSGAMSEGWIYTTTDGGVTWQPSDCGGSPFACFKFENVQTFHFADSEFGVALAGFVNPDFYISTDSGAYWDHQGEEGFSFFDPHTVFLLDRQYGWTLDDEDLAHTSDGAETWVGQGDGGSDIQFLTPTHGYKSRHAGLGTGISKSLTGGFTWDELDDFSDGPLYDISFVSDNAVDSTHGWAVGYGGRVLRTTDGGQTWVTQEEGTATLWAVDFVDRNFGWTVGNNGRIIATTDGGTSWQPQTANTTYHILDVHFIDRNYGWLVGKENYHTNWNGKIWKTTDGGASWQQMAHFAEQNNGAHGKHGVDFVNNNVGYVVGQSVFNGSIHKTVNGGETWTLILSGTDYPVLNKVDFVNENEGWAVGEAGVILHTSDGGQNWAFQPAGLSGTLFDVAFINNQIGYVVGQDGIFKTLDGGTTWTAEVTGTTSLKYAIAAPNAYRAWVTGQSGMIRTYTDENIPDIVQFNLANYQVNESDGEAVVMVTLAGDPGVLVQVDYATSDGSAMVDDDYTAVAGTLSFMPGEISKSFAVPIINDTVGEIDETITLTLSNVSNAELGTPHTATITIVDDDTLEVLVYLPIIIKK